MSVLITGHRGYIGSHLTDRIKEGNFQIPWIGCDLKEGHDFADKRRGVYETVVHLAASVSVTESLQRPDQYIDNNCLKILTFLRNNAVRRFIFISTAGVYGNCSYAKEEEAAWSRCLNPYAQSKYLGECVVRQLNWNHVILRLANVYGGNCEGRGEAAVHEHFNKDNPIVVYGGNQTRDFIHVTDVCDAIIRALLADMTGTYNIGSGCKTRIMDVANQFSSSRKVPIEQRFSRQGEIDHSSLNTYKARSEGL